MSPITAKKNQFLFKLHYFIKIKYYNFFKHSIMGTGSIKIIFELFHDFFFFPSEPLLEFCCKSTQFPLLIKEN